MSVRIKRIRIRNFRGIVSAQLDLGPRVTVLSGGNAEGKSSFLEAIKAPFQGGYDPRMVRDPAAPGAGSIIIGELPVDKKAQDPQKAVIEMELDDGSTLKRVIDAKRRTSVIECTSKTGEKLGGQGYVDQLAPVASLDPIQFLLADPKDRAKVVMQFLDVPLELDELSFIPTGDDGTWYLQYFHGKDGRALGCFEALKAVEDACVERRRNTNRRVAEITATIQNLRSSIPTLNDESADYAAIAKDAEEQYRAAESAYRVARVTIEEQARAAEDQANAKLEASNRETELWLAAEIAKLREQASERKRDAAAECSRVLGGIKDAYNESFAQVEAEHGPVVDEAREAHGEAKRNLEAFHNASGLRVHLKKQDQLHREILEDSLKMDRAIARLRELRHEKMAEVPIPGLEMRDGEVYYQGLLLDAINTAQQIEIAAQIVSAAWGELPLLILDNAEHLDESMRSRFLDALRGADCQVVLAEVTNGPLRIETPELAGAA